MLLKKTVLNVDSFKANIKKKKKKTPKIAYIFSEWVEKKMKTSFSTQTSKREQVTSWEIANFPF